MADTYNANDEVQQFKAWIKENGLSLVAGLTVGLAIVLGWQGWQAYDKHRSELASQRYGQLQLAVRASNMENAETYINELRDDYRSTPYPALASLQLAGGYARKDQLAQADEHLKWVMEYAADDKLRDLARLRRARLLWGQGTPDVALELLTGGKSSQSMMPLYAELRGDLLATLGRNDEARSAYAEAHLSYENPAERALVEQKLDDLAVSPAAETAPADKTDEEA